MSSNEEDLERIVAIEGPLTMNHRLGGGRLDACVRQFIAERLKPETQLVVRDDPTFHKLCVNAYVERANFEASKFKKNKNPNPNERPQQ